MDGFTDPFQTPGMSSTGWPCLVSLPPDSKLRQLPPKPPVILGSEQALAPVREPDTFAEGAWDKVPKTEGTFDRVLLNTTSHSYYKGWIDVLFICIRVLRTNFREKLPSQKILFNTKDVSRLKSHILEYHSIFVLAISKFLLTSTKYPWNRFPNV